MKIRHLLLCACFAFTSHSVIAKSMKKSNVTIAGGIAAASDPSEGNTKIKIDNGSVFQIIANFYDRGNSEDAKLYYEIFYASNKLESEVTPVGQAAYKTNIEATHLQFGGTYDWNVSPMFKPYFVMTIGGSQYRPETSKKETFFSGTLGVGGRFWVTNRIAIRLEARALGTVMDSSSKIFCQNNSCAIAISGTAWWQQQLTAGVSFAF